MPSTAQRRPEAPQRGHRRTRHGAWTREASVVREGDELDRAREPIVSAARLRLEPSDDRQAIDLSAIRAGKSVNAPSV